MTFFFILSSVIFQTQYRPPQKAKTQKRNAILLDEITLAVLQISICAFEELYVVNCNGALYLNNTSPSSNTQRWNHRHVALDKSPTISLFALSLLAWGII